MIRCMRCNGKKTLPRRQLCPVCQGRGKRGKRSKLDCLRCGGTGELVLAPGPCARCAGTGVEPAEFEVAGVGWDAEVEGG